MRLTVLFLAVPVVAASFAPSAAAAIVQGAAADAIGRAAPALVERAWHRGRPHPLVCTIRYRPFFNGLFWRTAPVRVCWRR